MLSHIRLKKKQHEYLLLRDDFSFHIIDVNENLTEAARQQILKACPSPGQMQSMGLSGMTIALSDLEGIAVHGVSVEADIVFHLAKKKLTYQLARRYEPKDIDDFFRGIPRVTIPARKQAKGRKHKDWRINEQVSEKRKRMSRVSFCLNCFSALLMVAMLLFQQWFDLLSVPAMLCAGAAIYLGVVHQAYFTFMSLKEYKKAGGKADVHELWFAFFPLGCLLIRGFSRFQFFDFGEPLGFGLILGCAVGLVLIFLTEDLKESWSAALEVILASSILSIGIIMQGNHLLAREPFVYQQVPVVDMYIVDNRKSDDYNCKVCFPDGRTLVIDVGRAAYDEFGIGDLLTIPIRTGGFGFEYGIY